MFCVGQLPLVAVVSIAVAKEEVRQSRIKSNKVHTGTRSVIDGRIKQTQETAVRVNPKVNSDLFSLTDKV